MKYYKKILLILIILLINCFYITNLFASIKAHIKTNLGDFTIELFNNKTPKTVENFITLSKKNYFNDIIFHRIIKGFMSQTGDPTGTGRGGPGYTFKDEFHKDLKHDKKGIVSMANRGPNTNGSQFFITAGPTQHLNNRHTIFGEVIEGIEVCDKINSVKTDRSDRPKKEVKIISITLEGIDDIIVTKEINDQINPIKDTLIKNHIELIKKKDLKEIVLFNCKNKGELYLFIWDVIYTDNSKDSFWIKAELKENKLIIKETHFTFL